MRIVMLGWEFPPFISGGLGTACQGLTAALDKQGHQVVFVLPRPAGKGQQGHVRVLAPQGGAGGQVHHATHGVDRPFGTAGGMGVHHPEFTASRIMGVPAGFASPYGVGGQVGLMGTKAAGQGRASGHAPDGTPLYEDARHGGWSGGGVESLYQGDLFIQAEQYARLVVAMVRGEQFDVIHAHDWLTFPAIATASPSRRATCRACSIPSRSDAIALTVHVPLPTAYASRSAEACIASTALPRSCAARATSSRASLHEPSSSPRSLTPDSIAHPLTELSTTEPIYTIIHNRGRKS